MGEPKTELQKNAILQARETELDTYQRVLDIHWLNNRMEDGRMGRCIALIQKEAEMEKDFQERTDHAAIVNARAAKETSLGLEIATVQNEEMCEHLRRQYLRERDPKLRELMTKLQAGYVCRDLRQQILHNQYKKLQDKSEEDHANALLRGALFSDQEAAYDEAKKKIARNSQYCAELQQQLVNKFKEKQCLYEDTLVEKKMLEQVMKTLADEDQRELKQKRELMEKMQKEIVTFKQAKLAWMEKQKKILIQEEKEIEKQLQAASDRSSSIIAERERKVREKEEINQRITAKILADEAARQHRENIIKLLQEQEYLEKGVQDDIAAKEKLNRVKVETKQALTTQMETKKKLDREQKQREVEFRKSSESKKATEDAKELEKNQKIKMKKQEYATALKQQIQDNARRRQAEQKLEDNRSKSVFDWDKAWRSEANEERNKIIEEHAPHLIGYLQAGVLKKTDIPSVRKGADQHPHLKDMPVESMTGVRRQKRFAKCNDQCMILREY